MSGTGPRVAMLGVCYDGSSPYLRGSAAAPPVIRKALWSEAGNPWTEQGLDLSTAPLDDEGDLVPHPDLYDEFEGDRYSHACPFARIMEEGLADQLVQLGIRTMSRHQREQARRFQVEVIEMQNWRDGTPLDFDMPVYLSFDLDVIEPGHAPGVSHREPGGLSVRQAIAIIQSFGGALAGADLVEFNPVADPTGLTGSVSAKLVKELAARMLVETR